MNRLDKFFLEKGKEKNQMLNFNLFFYQIKEKESQYRIHNHLKDQIPFKAEEGANREKC